MITQLSPTRVVLELDSPMRSPLPLEVGLKKIQEIAADLFCKTGDIVLFGHTFIHVKQVFCARNSMTSCIGLRTENLCHQSDIPPVT